ncbi:MAG TPA: TOBE domain-containing protein, partial [Clostridiaceae bacterium]|nr:TOBE domain-containing protein [Clostridiaceae bacterium]
QVFLMDEPLSNLDAKLRVEMRVQITKLYQQLKTTIIYVTHDQTEAMTMGTRIVVMKDGVVQQVASPTDLYNLPVNLFVARFIGMPPMNTIEGTLEKDETGLFVVAQPVGIDSPDRADNAVEPIKLRLLPRYETDEVLAHLGRPIILGIRPEHIYMETDAVARYAGTSLQVKAEVVEMLGAESYLYLKTPWNSNVTARINDQVHHVRYDDVITVALDPDHIHIFDYETEMSIIH